MLPLVTAFFGGPNFCTTMFLSRGVDGFSCGTGVTVVSNSLRRNQKKYSADTTTAVNTNAVSATASTLPVAVLANANTASIGDGRVSAGPEAAGAAAAGLSVEATGGSCANRRSVELTLEAESVLCLAASVR